MYKKIFVLFVVISSILFACPIETNALTYNDFSNNFLILEGEETVSEETTNDNDDLLEDYNKDQECTGGDSLLGDPNDPDSVAWLLQHFLDYIKILGPVLVIILSSVDFVGVIFKGDDDAMVKAKKKLITRLVLAACLFFIPMFVTVMLDLFGITGNATCGFK